MLKKWMIVLFVLLSVSASNAIETAERISDREIIERLTRLETKLDEGQKAIKEDISDIRLDVNNLRDFITWGFGVMFVSMFSLVGFVLWDRRSTLAPAMRKSKELEEREEKVEKALKRVAVQDLKLAEALRYVGLM